MKYGEVVSQALFVQDYDKKVHNAVLGLNGEAGEIAEYFKKLMFHPGKEPNAPALRQEIGDVLFYLALLNELQFGDSLLDVARDNITKLQGRWPERYAHVKVEELSL